MDLNAITEEQQRLWNGAAGRAWADTQDLLDRMFQPFETLLADSVPAGAAEAVLDIGCGTGAVTLAAARRLGPAGSASGIDISAPMLALAEARARAAGLTARFLRADAENHAFAPAAFDRILSRFGVMFFADPVRAFANLRRAARDGAALAAIAWRCAADNPFMTTAERAAAPFLPALPARRPGAPGQFAFADAEHVRRILDDAGWGDIGIRPLDVGCTFPRADLDRYLTRLGPVGLALQDAGETARARIVETVRAAFAPFVHGSTVRFTAACWMVEARAGTAGQRHSN